MNKYTTLTIPQGSITILFLYPCGHVNKQHLTVILRLVDHCSYDLQNLPERLSTFITIYRIFRGSKPAVSDDNSANVCCLEIFENEYSTENMRKFENHNL